MTLCILYNKPFDYSVKSLFKNKIKDFKFINFGNRISVEKKDILSLEEISGLLSEYSPISFILIGDIFWPTGQNICLYCLNNNIKCYFLQHGQWIYTENKKNPQYLPNTTFVFGNYLYKEIMTWPYGKRSNVIVSGNPRYDRINITQPDKENFIYFAPPVCLEKNDSSSNIVHDYNWKTLKQLKGIDKNNNIKIHLHYREGWFDLIKEWFPNAFFIDPQEDPIYWILKSSKVLTHRDSTTVLDSIACKRTVILTNSIGNDKSYYCKGYFKDFAVECDSVRRLEESMNDLKEFTNEKSDDYILLGNASEIILREMYN